MKQGCLLIQNCWRQKHSSIQCSLGKQGFFCFRIQYPRKVITGKLATLVYNVTFGKEYLLGALMIDRCFLSIFFDQRKYDYNNYYRIRLSLRKYIDVFFGYYSTNKSFIDYRIWLYSRSLGIVLIMSKSSSLFIVTKMLGNNIDTQV